MTVPHSIFPKESKINDESLKRQTDYDTYSHYPFSSKMHNPRKISARKEKTPEKGSVEKSHIFLQRKVTKNNNKRYMGKTSKNLSRK